MSTLAQMNSLFQSNASNARYYRSSGRSIPCPCKTFEGFRDPELHISFGKYGPQPDFTTSPGAIPANTSLAYRVLYLKNGTAIAPAIGFPRYSSSITDAVDFQVNMNLLQPVDFDQMDLYRSENGGPFLFSATVPATSTTYVDNVPLQGSTGTPIQEPVMCNESGEIPQSPIDIPVKAFVQPIQSTRATRLSTEYLQEVFGNIEADDHLGIFPVTWAGQRLEFHDWAQDGADFVEYNGERFFCINANMIPDPGDGNPEHHWEVGLRMIRTDGLVS